VTLEHILKPVQEAIPGGAGDNKVGESDAVFAGNEQCCEAAWGAHGKVVEAEAAPNGKVVRRNAEDEGTTATGPCREPEADDLLGADC
jgi:hypothetical protein